MDTNPRHTVVEFSKFEDERHLVYGEVYSPMVPDSQGDFMQAATIEEMAHQFMRESRITKIDVEHCLEEAGCFVVESFIARDNDPDFAKGAWVLGVHIPDPDIWAKVKKGDINGFSMYGNGKRVERVLEIEVPEDGILKGDTAVESDHQHEFFLNFDDEGNFLGGGTDEVSGHSHVIKAGTVTETASGHSHRYTFMDALRI